MEGNPDDYVAFLAAKATTYAALVQSWEKFVHRAKGFQIPGIDAIDADGRELRFTFFGRDFRIRFRFDFKEQGVVQYAEDEPAPLVPDFKDVDRFDGTGKLAAHNISDETGAKFLLVSILDLIVKRGYRVPVAGSIG